MIKKYFYRKPSISLKMAKEFYNPLKDSDFCKFHIFVVLFVWKKGGFLKLKLNANSRVWFLHFTKTLFIMALFVF